MEEVIAQQIRDIYKSTKINMTLSEEFYVKACMRLVYYAGRESLLAEMKEFTKDNMANDPRQ